ncbi:MAG: alpha/beta hydrolase fold domain-containing protein [Planctomycetota bacterium]|jgi:acetyl esterase/lipase
MRLRIRSTVWMLPIALAVAAVTAPARAGEEARRPSNTAGKPEVELWPVGKAPGQKSGKPRVKPGWLNGIYEPWMAVHLPPKDEAVGAAVVVCPGGGYGGLAYNHEGIQVARWLNSHGVAGFVLRYRHNPHRHPIPLGDAQRAVRIVRTRAPEWGVDPSRIGIMGFSAGGHPAASAATHFDEGDPRARDPVDRASSRPDFAILIYPVISMKKGVTHGGSRNNLLGRDPDERLVKLMSNELQVTARTPPSFLVHSSDDRAVPIANSQLFHEACVKAGVPSELRVYEQGGHGYGMGRKGHDSAEWPARCIEWMKARKLFEGMSARRHATVKSGDTLWKLAQRLYGNRHFARVIALHNNIADAAKLSVGLDLRVPDLKMLLVDEGLCEVAESEVDAILGAHALFREHERRLLDTRKGKGHAKVAVPEAVADDLREAAKRIDTAIAGLRAKRDVKTIPRLMIGQLEGVSRNLKELAGGSNDGYGYDIDMVHQRLVHAICNGIKWSRSGFH